MTSLESVEPFHLFSLLIVGSVAAQAERESAKTRLKTIFVIVLC
jgi:hypothetical protein